MLDHYGAYLTHLTALLEDKGLKSTDRQRLRGNVLHWREGKKLLGCALCVDILQPPALLSLQGESVDVVFAIKHILKSVIYLPEEAMYTRPA